MFRRLRDDGEVVTVRVDGRSVDGRGAVSPRRYSPPALRERA
jgi:hypothetical protein